MRGSLAVCANSTGGPGERVCVCVGGGGSAVSQVLGCRTCEGWGLCTSSQRFPENWGCGLSDRGRGRKRGGVSRTPGRNGGTAVPSGSTGAQLADAAPWCREVRIGALPASHLLRGHEVSWPLSHLPHVSVINTSSQHCRSLTELGDAGGLPRGGPVRKSPLNHHTRWSLEVVVDG